MSLIENVFTLEPLRLNKSNMEFGINFFEIFSTKLSKEISCYHKQQTLIGNQRLKSTIKTKIKVISILCLPIPVFSSLSLVAQPLNVFSKTRFFFHYI
jgi:hypothetical protein